MTDIPISLKLYKVLEKHANNLSKKLERKVTVDEIANAAFKHGLENPEITQKVIEEWRKQKMDSIIISFKQNRGDHAFVLSREGVHTSYTGRIARLGNVTRYFAREFSLTTNEALEVQHKILRAYVKWNTEKQVPSDIHKATSGGERT